MKEYSVAPAIPCLLLWILLSAYYSYRSWFDARGLERSMRREVERLPRWYPFRQYSLDRFGTRPWVWQTRILSTMGVILGILAVGAVFVLLLRPRIP